MNKLEMLKMSEKEILEEVKQDGLVLQFVDKQTEEICLAAVKEDGCALGWVNPELITEEILSYCEISIDYAAYAMYLRDKGNNERVKNV